MRKIALLVAFLISVLVVPSAMAVDASWRALQREWNAQQAQQRTDEAKFKAMETEASKAVSSLQGKPQTAPVRRGSGSAAD